MDKSRCTHRRAAKTSRHHRLDGIPPYTRVQTSLRAATLDADRPHCCPDILRSLERGYGGGVVRAVEIAWRRSGGPLRRSPRGGAPTNGDPAAMAASAA